MSKRLNKDIEREAFAAAKKQGLQGKAMAATAHMEIRSAQWNNGTDYPPGKPCSNSNGAGAKSY